MFTSYPSLRVFFDLSVRKSNDLGSAFKNPKKKKKALKQKPKQKSAFKLKTTKKPKTFSHHAGKPKPKPKSRSPPELKLKPLPKSKPKPKTKVYPQNPRQSHYKPHLKSHSSGTPSLSETSLPKSQLQIQPRFKSKSRRTITQNQKLSRSRPTQAKSKTQLKLHLKSKSRRTLSQYWNMSQPRTVLKSHSTPQLTLQSSQTVWDTSVQAAIRVGDWKLLTGDPGHGDWVPPQVLQHTILVGLFSLPCFKLKNMTNCKFCSSGTSHSPWSLVEP